MPEILVSQHGCDSHWLDPLAGLRISIDGCCLAHASEALVTSTVQMLVLGFADRAAAASKAFLNGGTCSR
jgi:hypothetical protein